MTRIAILATIEAAPTAWQPMLAAVAAQLGMLPNLYRLISVRPQSLGGYLGLYKALGRRQLSLETWNRIALAVAEANRSEYCLAEHIYMGRDLLKMNEDEMEANRAGQSGNERPALVRFAAKVTSARGRIFEGDLDLVRAVGYGDDEIIETISLVAINTWANYITKIFDTKVDFPVVVEYEPA